MNLIIQLPILLFSIVIHECAHGWTAERFGDDTARVMGRLTLNPIPHIDMFGTILLPIMAAITGAPIFGWAKPVPVNPNRLSHPVRDMFWVSLSGPAANLTLAVTAAFGIWILRSFPVVFGGLTYTIFDLLRFVLVINVVLAVFNLIPIPPLDGSHIMTAILPPRLAYKYMMIERYGFFIIIILLASGVLWGVLGPIISFIISALTGGLRII